MKPTKKRRSETPSSVSSFDPPSGMLLGSERDDEEVLEEEEEEEDEDDDEVEDEEQEEEDEEAEDDNEEEDEEEEEEEEEPELEDEVEEELPHKTRVPTVTSSSSSSLAVTASTSSLGSLRPVELKESVPAVKSLVQKTEEIGWDKMLSGLRLRRIVKENHGRSINQIAFNPEVQNRNLLATVGDNQVNIYDNEHCGDHLDLVSHYVHETADGSKTEFLCCCWLKEEEDAILAVGGTCQQVYILSLARSKVLRILAGHAGPIIDLVRNPVAPDLLYSVGMNDAIRIWNWKTGAVVKIVDVSATVLAIHSLGVEFITGDSEGNLRKWTFDPVSAEEKRNQPLQGKKLKTTLHRTTVDSITYVGNTVLSKSINGRIEHWDPATEKVLKSFHLKGSSGNNYCRLDLSHDASHFCVGDGQGVVHIFNLQTGKLVTELRHKRSRNPIRCSVFNHNSRNVVYGGKGTLVWRCDYIDEETLAEWAKLAGT